MTRLTKVKSMTAGIALSLLSTGAVFADLPESFADLAEEVSPAVVRITTTSMVETGGQFQIPDGAQIPDFFRDFLEQNQGLQQKQQQQPSRGLGSGFIVDAAGIIVTNNHVIDGADSIVVETVDGETFPAEVIGRDVKTDVAVLKVTSDTELPTVEFGNSDDERVGDWVMAIGNPLGQDFSVTTGIISARHRALDGAFDDFIQTDAAINRGNSGGPLFNMDGEVVGMNTAILSPNGGSIGLGFAMSSNVVSNIVDQIEEFGEARRGKLGVAINSINDEMAEALGLKNANGALVADVPEGPAKDAGIKAGDVILKFDGEDIEDANGLVKAVGNTAIDKTVSVELYRQSEDKNIEVRVQIGQLENDTPKVAAVEPDAPEVQTTGALGMQLVPFDQKTAELYGSEIETGGLIIKDIDRESEAAKRGVMPDDIIREVNQVPVNTVAEFTTQVEEANKLGRKALLLLIEREGSALFLALPLDEK